MSVVIVGGNECMVRKYKDLCKEYNCRAKVFTKMTTKMKNKIGSPDLMVLFTGAMSHKMVRCALSEVKGQNTVIARAQTGSMTSLRDILERHTL